MAYLVCDTSAPWNIPARQTQKKSVATEPRLAVTMPVDILIEERKVIKSTDADEKGLFSFDDDFEDELERKPFPPKNENLTPSQDDDIFGNVSADFALFGESGHDREGDAEDIHEEEREDGEEDMQACRAEQCRPERRRLFIPPHVLAAERSTRSLCCRPVRRPGAASGLV